jgi:hypothetical protein
MINFVEFELKEKHDYEDKDLPIFLKDMNGNCAILIKDHDAFKLVGNNGFVQSGYDKYEYLNSALDHLEEWLGYSPVSVQVKEIHG